MISLIYNFVNNTQEKEWFVNYYEKTIFTLTKDYKAFLYAYVYT